MNSQSLPRLLSRNQSASFDSRECWCLDPEYAPVLANREDENGALPFLDESEDVGSPLADCDFAATFGAIVVMPQGWLPDESSGWTEDRQEKVVAITRDVIQRYNGDASRVVLTGQSEGGRGAWNFAGARPELWSALNVICAPTAASDALAARALPVWVVGSVEDGLMGNDDLVSALKREAVKVRYTRYTKSPPPPDPKYRSMSGHASYDLVYRDPRLWEWALSHENAAAENAWRV
eukprot:TRINITY_DN5369_c0_g1_i2.p2 TRINITY_DN5369_c0_g1~~TRINITY_DN5369_c0_g1_i2.p2  ORF type:complete len:236 (+),score=40.51 TRINITY_DN5369_c0_g1_i2:436-1143(+)